MRPERIGQAFAAVTMTAGVALGIGGPAMADGEHDGFSPNPDCPSGLEYQTNLAAEGIASDVGNVALAYGDRHPKPKPECPTTTTTTTCPPSTTIESTTTTIETTTTSTSTTVPEETSTTVPETSTTIYIPTSTTEVIVPPASTSTTNAEVTTTTTEKPILPETGDSSNLLIALGAAVAATGVALAMRRKPDLA